MTVEVGKVAIRAIPDTKGFRQKLEDALKKDARSLPPIQVIANVERININRQKVRRSLQEQFNNLRGLRVDVDVNANLSRLRAQVTEAQEAVGEVHLIPTFDRIAMQRVNSDIRGAIRDIELNVDITDGFGQQVRRTVNDLERQMRELNEMSLFGDLSDSEFDWLHRELDRVRHELNHVSYATSRLDEELDNMAEDRTVRVDVNPFTAWASARLAWLTRPRMVEIIPQVSAVAWAKAQAALAALSGARMSYDILKRFSDWVTQIDRKLPQFTLGLLSATTAVSGILGAISGLVGIGDGLAATLPSLLLLPGLFAGAAMSAVALFVALKHSKSELAELGDGYNNLGRIIRVAFWEEARPAIVEFSNSIMPQLERSFQKTSSALGRFTARLARSLRREFANGRLEAMFDGLAAAWDVLATGTDAFARAITNLGLVAAQYMPRLAQWFVDLSIKFDNWLSDVSTDGRLADWIEESIDAFYALWDVLAATTGIFQGLWKAAEAGGSGGLRGFADMLLSWEEAINGAKWQDTLTAMFRGAGEAMSGLSDGLQRVGDMLYGLRGPIEYFMGESGQALGRFIGNIAEALDRPEIAEGIRSLIDGLAKGLDALQPAMGPLADAFARLMGFIGELGAVFGPALSRILEAIAPLFVAILDAVEPLVPILTDGLVRAIETLLPPLTEFVSSIEFEDLAIALAEAFVDLTEALVPLLPALTPVVNSLIESLLPVLPDLVSLTESFTELMIAFLEGIVPHLPSILELVTSVVQLAAGLAEVNAVAATFMGIFIDGVLTVVTIFTDYVTSAITATGLFAEAVSKLLAGDFVGAADTAQQAIQTLQDSFSFDSVIEKVQGLVDRTAPKLDEFAEKNREVAANGISYFTSEMDLGAPKVEASAENMVSGATGALDGIGDKAKQAGSDFGAGFAKGIEGAITDVAYAAARMAAAALESAKAELDINSPSRVAEREIGAMFGAGWVRGQNGSLEAVRESSAQLASAALDGMRSSRTRVIAGTSELARGNSFASDSLPAQGRVVQVHAPVTANVIERDPDRLGREIGRGVEVALGYI